jgi:hypothetical protein
MAEALANGFDGFTAVEQNACVEVAQGVTAVVA